LHTEVAQIPNAVQPRILHAPHVVSINPAPRKKPVDDAFQTLRQVMEALPSPSVS